MRRIKRRSRRKIVNHRVILRTKIKKERMKKTMVIAGFLAISFIFAVAAFYYIDFCMEYLLDSDSFNIREISACGTRVLDQEMIISSSKNFIGSNIFTFNKKELTQKISSISVVKNVKIKKVYPDKLVLMIEEREALGRIAGSPDPALIDKNGVVFDDMDRTTSYPLIYAEKTSAVLKKVSGFLDDLRTTDPLLYSRLESLDARNLKNLKLTFADIEVDWGQLNILKEDITRTFKKNIACLNAVLDDLRSKSIKKGFLDLRFLDEGKGKVIFRHRN